MNFDIKLLIKIVTVALLYFLSAKAVAPLSLVESGSVFAIWPPTGIALSALFIFGYRIWAGIFLGAFLLNLTLSPILPSFQIAITNTLGPVIGYWFLLKYADQRIFSSLRSMVIFFFSITLASIITAGGGSLTLLLHNFIPSEAVFNVWCGWFLGDLIGFLLLVPIVVSMLYRKDYLKNLFSIEGILMITTLIIIGLITFGPLELFDRIQYPVVYLLLPPLIWSTLRFTPFIVSTSLLIVALASIYGTILSYGPFLRDDPNSALILLQSFNSILAITILLICAVFQEKESVKDNLKKNKENLEEIVNKRTIELEDTNKELLNTQEQLQLINNSLEERVQEEVKKNKEKEQQLLIASKMSSLGDMIGNIAHQWRQPLSIISTIASGITMKKEFGTLEKDYDISSDMTTIVKQAEYLSSTIDTFRDFIKGSNTAEDVVFQDVVDEALNIVNASLQNNYIELKKDFDKEQAIMVHMNPSEFSQALINILNNAKDVLSSKEAEDKWIKVSIYQKDKTAILSIEDNGGGVPENIIDKIFEPYFTTKHKSQGTGLGLNISYTIIVESLHGQLYVKNTKNGAKFFIELETL